jgi:ABC-2 type transport system ATP-binding protein
MISVKNLVKEYKVRKAAGGFKGLFFPEYKNIRAVDDISFDIPKGEMTGFIGPNGAGKSTTIKVLVSILTPTSGEVTINGMKPSTDRKDFVKNIGAMFGQKTQLWWDLPLEDSYLLLKDIYGIDDKTYGENMKIFNEVLELDQFIHQPVRHLSLGQRVRGDLAAALLHNPEVVFLDEPTLGIDFLVKKKIHRFIKTICDMRRTTLFLTSHDIADIENLCRRIIVINNGKIAYDGSITDLRAAFGTMRKLDVEFADIYPDFEIEGAALLSSESNKKTYAFSGGVSPSDLIVQISRKHEVANLTIREPEIEDIISEIYQNKGTGAQ